MLRPASSTENNYCTCLSIQCYLAPTEGDDDPAVYRTTRSMKAQLVTLKSNREDQANRNHVTNGSDASDRASEASENEEGGDALLTVQPDFNSLLFVLRDERVMQFVKYLSASAQAADGISLGSGRLACRLMKTSRNSHNECVRPIACRVNLSAPQERRMILSGSTGCLDSIFH